jgi:iron complex outermembrane receptor protein
MQASSFVAFGALFVASLSAPLAAQSVTSITGRIVSADGGAPVVGAFVSLDGGRPVAQSDAGGRFQLSGVPAGAHSVEARRVGFTAASVTVTVDAATPVDLMISLAPEVAVMGAVTVIGTKTDLDETRQRIALVPGSVAMIEPATLRATRQANLKDALQFTSGVYVQPRFGAADESQISVRGSGLRDNFHARGINLLVNGMPYRNADGFTDFESLELLTTEAIQVYKGANALRFGGSTLGGAINLDTKTGYSASPVGLFAQGGSYGFHKTQLESGATRGRFDYYASYAHTGLGGYRDWADQKRDRVNLHAGVRLSPKVDTRAFYFFAHVEEHLPGSLTKAAFDSAPRSADPGNVTGKWGREYDLHHVGVQLRTQLTPTQRLDISPYMQYRDIDHPIFQVISQVSRDFGAEIRYENTASLFGMGNRLTLGAQPATEGLNNRQYVNVAGKHGALTKDQHDVVGAFGLYAEDVLSFTPRFSGVLGARYERSTRKSTDYFLSNGDQSDSRTYKPVTPRAGVVVEMPGMRGQIFANVSRTFEPPLLLELNSLTVPGFIDLRGQDALQYELGARGNRLGLAWDVALYDVELKNEILNVNVQPFPGAPFTVPTYRNADRTRHRGLEAGVAWQLPGAVFVRGVVADHIVARAAYTFSRFTFERDAAFEGNDIPGAPSHHATAEIRYEHPSGFSVAPSVEWVPKAYFVNSENSMKNDGWFTLGFRAEWNVARVGLTAFVAGQNVGDRHYSGSVQVDNAAGKFFEPADGRTFYGGLRWAR